jgi:hypothetical protein
MVMKKIFTLLLMISILVSCSDWKYSNGVKRQKRSYTYLNPKAPAEKEILAEQRSNNSVSDEETIPQNQTVETVDPKLVKQEIATETVENETILVKTKKLESDEDSIKPLTQEMVDEAAESEELGRESRNLGIAGLILQLTLIFGIVGLVLSIVGLAKGISSLIADYNTPKGVRMARTGVIFSSITIALYILPIIAIIILLLVLI